MNSIHLLRSLIKEAIHASSEYMRREEIRERIQRDVIGLIRSNRITNESDLNRYFWYIADTDGSSDVQLALTTLKSIPFHIWKKL